MKILVVDDSTEVLDGMREGINWCEIGMESVYYAECAADAKQLILKEKPDILLTDIEMPGEDGLSLWCWAKEQKDDMKCVFLTSHADFAYAQKAIRKGGFDYILQPAKAETIEETILNCRNQILAERRMQYMAKKGMEYDSVSRKALERLACALFIEGKRFQGRMAEWNAEAVPDGCDVCFYPGMFVFEMENPEKEIKLFLEKSVFGKRVVICRPEQGVVGLILICQSTMDNAFPRQVLIELKKELETCKGYSSELYLGKMEKKDLPQCVEVILQMRKNNVAKSRKIFEVPEKEYRCVQPRNPESKQWKKWILNGDGVLVRNQINNLIRNANEEGTLTLDYMSMLFWCFSDACSLACQELNLQMSDLFDKYYSIEKFRNCYQNVEEFRKAIQFCLESFDEKKHTAEGRERTIEERISLVRMYIDEHLEEPLSRSEMASYVFLNEDYFSRMFKKYIGKGYKEYVLEKKMDYACKLLRETKFSVSIVSARVGYDYFSNFAQTFKKYTGKTPQEYRKEYEMS